MMPELVNVVYFISGAILAYVVIKAIRDYV